MQLKDQKHVKYTSIYTHTRSNQRVKEVLRTNRERGANLGHGDADEPSEEGDDDPPPHQRRRPRVHQARTVQRRDPREQRHRRERDRQGLKQSLLGIIQIQNQNPQTRVVKNSKIRSKSKGEGAVV